MYVLAQLTNQVLRAGKQVGLESSIECLSNVPGQLQVLDLVLAHRNMRCPVPSIRWSDSHLHLYYS